MVCLTAATTAVWHSGRLIPPPPTAFGALGPWVDLHGAPLAAVAVVRVVLLGVLAWLVVTTLAALLARAVGGVRAVRWADALLTPAQRRLLGVGVTVGLSLAQPAAVGAMPVQVPERVTMTVIDDPVDRATDPVPDPDLASAPTTAPEPAPTSTTTPAPGPTAPGTTTPAPPDTGHQPAVPPSTETPPSPAPTVTSPSTTSPSTTSPSTTSGNAAGPAGPHPPPRTEIMTMLDVAIVDVGAIDAAPHAPTDPFDDSPAAGDTGPPTAGDTAAVAPVPGRDPAATWTIQPGDHLWAVANRTLRAHGLDASNRATADYLNTLIGLNQAVFAVPGEPDLVYCGQVFELPALPDR